MKPSGIIGFILACGILALSLSSCGLIVINYPKDADGADSDTAFTETNETENAGYEKTEKDYSKEAAARLEKLLRSAVANWEAKNERKAESGDLYISTIYVNPAATLKRLRPAPQGRGYRIRKRSNHVTIIVDTIDNKKA